MSRKTPENKTQRRRSSPDVVTKYAQDVVKGVLPAGEPVRNACSRHLRDLECGEERGIVWDWPSAKRVIDYFQTVLRLNGGEFEGVKFDLLPWQAFIIGSLFGWKSSDGTRRFRVAFIETAKGSGKSPLAAGVGLYMLTADDEPRAEVYAAATKQDQAKVLFRDAVAMVQQSPALASRLDMAGGVDKTNIAHIASGSFFRPISSENRGRGQSGPRPHCALLDEVHEHPTNAIVEFLRAGTKGRRQALIFMITNSGSDKESVCYDYHDYGCKVCSGAIEDDAFFAYICAIDEKDDPLNDESCWGKANPSLGVTFGPKYLREQVTQARGMPSKQNLVLRLNFCRWTDSDAAWIGRDQWEACETTLDLYELRGRRCIGGLDLSSKRDLTALALCFPDDDGETADIVLEFWTPKDTLADRALKDRVDYQSWADAGYLHAVPGKTIQYSFVASRIAELAGWYEIGGIAYDRWKIDEFKTDLAEEDASIELFPYGQGFKDMGPAVANLEELILAKKLRVHMNPVLRWNVASLVTEEDAAGSRKFTKAKATGRIDGAVAMAMAVGAWKRGLIPLPSIWDHPDAIEALLG